MMPAALSPASAVVCAEWTRPLIISAHVNWVHLTRREKGDTGAKKKKKKQKKKNKDKAGGKDVAQDPLAKVSVFLWLCVFNKII